jgi:hypothetical protein
MPHPFLNAFKKLTGTTVDLFLNTFNVERAL